MRSRGYRVASASAARVPAPDEQVFLAMRIGAEQTERIHNDAVLPMTCLVRLKGTGRSGHSQRWTVAKEFVAALPQRQVWLTFHADVIVTGEVSDEVFARRLQDCHACLRGLLEDARRTLTERARERAPTLPRRATGATVHIELVGISDLVAGRSGLLRSSRGEAVTAEGLAERIRACDVIEHEILADVATMLRALSNVGASIVPALPGDESALADAASRVAVTANDHLAAQMKSHSYHNGE
jgi:hypothetical protein